MQAYKTAEENKSENMVGKEENVKMKTTNENTYFREQNERK